MVEAGTGALRTYRQVDDLANQTSHLLRSLGLGVGDHVALWFDNDLDYPALWWGARYAGLYYTLISTRLTPAEAGHIITDSGSRVVLLGRRLWSEHGAALRAHIDPGTRLIVDGERLDQLRPLLAAQSTEPLTDRVEGVPMLYSSGTTGQPKAVKRTISGAELGTTTTGVVRGRAPRALPRGTGLDQVAALDRLHGRAAARAHRQAAQAQAPRRVPGAPGALDPPRTLMCHTRSQT